MRNRWAATSVVALGLAGTCVAGGSQLQQRLRDTAVGTQWIYDDLDQARAQAKGSNKPILALLRCVP